MNCNSSAQISITHNTNHRNKQAEQLQFIIMLIENCYLFSIYVGPYTFKPLGLLTRRPIDIPYNRYFLRQFIFLRNFADKKNLRKLEQQNIQNNKIKMLSKCIVKMKPQKLETHNMIWYLFQIKEQIFPTTKNTSIYPQTYRSIGLLTQRQTDLH